MYSMTTAIPAYLPRALAEDVNLPELRDWRSFELTSDNRPQTDGACASRKETACAG